MAITPVQDIIAQNLMLEEVGARARDQRVTDIVCGDSLQWRRGSVCTRVIA